ncbi:hypothetical protein SDC9_192556 [bioreactor metagenome]|uniref:Uncharacterized protein n=1 Tax=bioreactor metagenome TaxID=1076179 RepID=A0A645I3F5_9ZZZZ
MNEVGEIRFGVEDQISQFASGLVERSKIRRGHTVADQRQQMAKQTVGDAADLAQQADEVGLIDTKAQGTGRSGFNVVAFIHDQVLIIGQHPAAGDHVGQEQGMVDDQNVC